MSGAIFGGARWAQILEAGGGRVVEAGWEGGEGGGGAHRRQKLLNDAVNALGAGGVRHSGNLSVNGRSADAVASGESILLKIDVH